MVYDRIQCVLTYSEGCIVNTSEADYGWYHRTVHLGFNDILTKSFG